MKKSILGCMCLILAMSCDVPQSVTVKGNPELYLSLGSPFSQLKEGERLEDYISAAKIEEMMGGKENVTAYEYLPPGLGPDDPKAYVVHYPIAEVQHNVTDYVNDAFSDDKRQPPYNIPANLSSFPVELTREGDPQGAPLFKISFSDMYKKVIKVESGPFGIDLDYSADFENYLWLKIPAFGMDTWTQGVKEGDKLRFYNSGKTEFVLADLTSQGELEIYVQVSGPCSGTIDPQPVFEWTTADVKLTGKDGTQEGQRKIENFLGKFLGEGVEFKEARGYIYAHGIDNTATIMLQEVGGAELVASGTPLLNKPKISFPDPFIMDLSQHPHSIDPNDLDGEEFIDLTGLVNNPDSSTLRYEIAASQMTIQNNEGQMTGDNITVDLVILLPLDFIVTMPSSKPGYVKLDMGDVFDPKGNDDLFGRKGKDDDFFSNINGATIFVKKFQNTVIKTVLDEPISVLVNSTGSSFPKVIDLKEGDATLPLQLNSNELLYPFTPKFEILLKEDSPGAGAEFKILRQENPDDPPIFDFSLTVEAKTDLNVKL